MKDAGLLAPKVAGKVVKDAGLLAPDKEGIPREQVRVLSAPKVAGKVIKDAPKVAGKVIKDAPKVAGKVITVVSPANEVDEEGFRMRILSAPARA